MNEPFERLPDPIIQHIGTFLYHTQAVRLSSLSKRLHQLLRRRRFEAFQFHMHVRRNRLRTHITELGLEDVFLLEETLFRRGLTLDLIWPRVEEIDTATKQLLGDISSSIRGRSLESLQACIETALAKDVPLRSKNLPVLTWAIELLHEPFVRWLIDDKQVSVDSSNSRGLLKCTALCNLLGMTMRPDAAAERLAVTKLLLDRRIKLTCDCVKRSIRDPSENMALRRLLLEYIRSNL